MPRRSHRGTGLVGGLAFRRGRLGTLGGLAARQGGLRQIGGFVAAGQDRRRRVAEAALEQRVGDADRRIVGRGGVERGRVEGGLTGGERGVVRLAGRRCADVLGRHGLGRPGLLGGGAVATAARAAAGLALLALPVLLGLAGLVLEQGLTVRERDLVVVRVDLAEGEEAVAVAAVLDEGGLERGLHAGHLGEVDIAAKLAPVGGLEVEFLDPRPVNRDDPGLLRVHRVDEHLVVVGHDELSTWRSTSFSSNRAVPMGHRPVRALSARRIGARDDPGKGVAEAVGKGLPPTAVGRRISARVGLILARVDEKAPPRETRRR